MANLVETNRWEAGIYQFETSDPVMGGPNGVDNRPTRELANRTLWLKTELAKAVEAIGKTQAITMTAGAGLIGGGNLTANWSIALATPSTLSGSTTNWAGNGNTGHTHELAAATPLLAGVAKLVNTLNSAATDAALTAAMGKKLNDEKMPHVTYDYSTASSPDYSRSGFYRANGSVNQSSMYPAMEIHISHPSHGGSAYARGIGFAYGHHGWQLTTTAWDETGTYRGQKVILTEDNGVMLTGDQNIGGTKSFSGTLETKYRMVIRRNGEGLIPYQWLINEKIDLMAGVATETTLGQIEFRAGDSSLADASGRSRGMVKVLMLPDKSGVLEGGAYNGSNQYSVGFKYYSGTGNFVIRGNDNGMARLQVPNGGIWAQGFISSSLTTWPKLILASNQGNQALLLESGGTATTHKLIVREHDGGVPTNKNIATFALPNVTGDKTLATTEDVQQSVQNVAMKGSTLSHYGITDAVTVTDFNWAHVKPGTIAYYGGDVAPHGWLACNGAAISRTSFVHLFNILGTRYGAGDGRTTFNLPDLRGEFIRGWDAGRGVDLNRVLGSFQNDEIRSHAHIYRRSHITNTVDWEQFEARRDGSAALYDGDGRFDDGGDRVTTNHVGGPETRPRNIALLACIKA